MKTIEINQETYDILLQVKDKIQDIMPETFSDNDVIRILLTSFIEGLE